MAYREVENENENENLYVWEVRLLFTKRHDKKDKFEYRYGWPHAQGKWRPLTLWHWIKSQPTLAWAIWRSNR